MKSILVVYKVFLSILLMVIFLSSCSNNFDDAVGLLQSGDQAGAAKIFEELADKGDVLPQSIIASYYEYGSGVPKDSIQAHKWYSLALSGGLSDKDGRKATIFALKNLEKKMKPKEIAEAKKLAQEWVPK